MTRASFEPFRKIFEAPLQHDDTRLIAAALSDDVDLVLAAEAADLLHRFSVLIEITKTVAASESLDDLFPRLMDVITAVLRAERATLFLYDAETDELFSRLAKDDGIEEIRIPAVAGVAGTVFQSGMSLNIPDAYSDPHAAKALSSKEGKTLERLLRQMLAELSS